MRKKAIDGFNFTDALACTAYGPSDISGAVIAPRNSGRHLGEAVSVVPVVGR